MSGANSGAAANSWPINYPCIVLRDWPPAGANVPSNVVSVRKDQIGGITNINRQSGDVLLQLPTDMMGRPGRFGWVPQRILKIGNTRTIQQGPIIQINEPDCPPLPTNLYVDNAGLLSKTVSGLLSSYHVNRDALAMTPMYLEKGALDTDNKIRAVGSNIVRGFGRAGTGNRDYWNSGNFTAVEIMQVCTNGQTDDRSGIYWIFLGDFKDDPNRGPELYAGSTITTFRQRYSGYIRDENDPKCHRRVIKAWRQARFKRMVPVCILPGIIGGSPEIKLAEQVVMDMSQTMARDVVSFARDSDFQDGEEITDNDSKLSKASKTILRKEQASILSRLADQVFEKTGWPGCVRRRQMPSIPNLKSFGPTVGLNSQDPISEMDHAKTIWVRTDGPGFREYRRSNYRVYIPSSGADAVNLCIFSKTYRYNTEFRALVKPSDDLPPPDTKVHNVIEIRTDDKLHPIPVSRLPAVGPFSNNNDGNRIGLRTEWLDEKTGQWKGVYYQMGIEDKRVEKAPLSGGSRHYNVGYALHRFVNQQRPPKGSEFEWLWDFGQARIKHLYFDHLDQAIRLKDINEIHDAPTPTISSFPQVGQQLMKLGAGRMSTPQDRKYPLFPNGQGNEGSRTSCDGCKLAREWGLGGAGATMCYRSGDKNICQKCEKVGRPCTFTPTKILMNKDHAKLRRALAAPLATKLFYTGTRDADMVTY